MFRRYRFAFTPLALIVMLLGASGVAFGQLDASFGTGGLQAIPANQSCAAMATYALPDNKLLVLYENSNTEEPFLARLNTDGSLDTSFGSGGAVKILLPFFTPAGRPDILGSARQPDGKIVVAGGNGADLALARLNADGSMDTSFGAGVGIVYNGFSASTELLRIPRVLPDGKIMVMGETNGLGNGLFFLRYNADGTIDSTFGSGQPVYTGNTGSLSTFEVLPNGKLLLKNGAGNIRGFNADGSVDSGFTTDSVNYRGMAILPDGKFLASSTTPTAESFDRTNDDAVLTRFNGNGTVDTGFGTGGSVVVSWTRYVEEYARAIVPMSDGSILFGGTANIPGNRSKFRNSVAGFAMISSAGTVTGKLLTPGLPVPASFFGNSNANVIVLSNGKIVAAGTVPQTSGPASYQVTLAQLTGVPMNEYKFRPSKFDFAYDNDGIATRVIFRPSTGYWYPGDKFGTAGDIPVADDYLGAGFGSEFAVFRPSNGTWYISKNLYLGPESNAEVVQFGLNGDIPAQADFDGDLKADIAVFRPSSGVWYLRNSSDTQMSVHFWGLNGDKPVQGDYDGDGFADIAVYRPSNGGWYISKSSGGISILQFGMSGDIPVNDDYDGDGKMDVAVWRPSTGIWYIINSADNSFTIMQWGLSDDIAVPADYDGDGKTDIAVFRPSTGVWYTYESTTNQMHVAFWGLSTDVLPAARQ